MRATSAALTKEIVRWIFERDPHKGREPIHLGFQLDGDLVTSLGFDAGQRRSCFVYSGVPFEFVPFGWQGGDALQYGHLVHAPELGQIDYPVGSFSPADDTGVWWLGDDTRAGIQNLLSANLRVAQEDPDWGGTVDDFLGDEALVALCERFAFQLVPTIDPDVTRGGRSDRRIAPLVPPGWLFKPTRNGVGVLAPEASFASLPPLLAYDHQGDLQPFLDRARGYLQAAQPGSALCQLYEVHRAGAATAEYEALILMQRSYEQLGRPLLAERVARRLARCPALLK